MRFGISIMEYQSWNELCIDIPNKHLFYSTLHAFACLASPQTVVCEKCRKKDPKNHQRRRREMLGIIEVYRENANLGIVE